MYNCKTAKDKVIWNVRILEAYYKFTISNSRRLTFLVTRFSLLSGVNVSEAKDKVAELVVQGRYLQDIWS